MVCESSIPISDPVMDGVVAVGVVVYGGARTQAWVPPGAAIPSAHAAALPSLMSLDTTPRTRSAGDAGFAVFQACRNVDSWPLSASKFALVPQNRPFLGSRAPATRSSGSSVGLMV